MDAHASDLPESDLTARLREAITRGRFMPNERLVEADLAQAFGANRTNIRMALAMLDQEGLVVRERNRGARVRLVTNKEALEIAELRLAIEAMLARHAAARVTDGDRTTLRAVVGRMETAHRAQDYFTFSQLNADLHREIQRVADNVTASRLLQTLKSQIVRLQYRAILLPGRPDQSLAEHRAIVEAICAGDGDTADAAMRRHLAMVRNALEQTIRATTLSA